MNTSKLKQYAGVACLFAIAGALFYYSTLTEEVRLVLSDASLKGKVSYKGKPVPYALVILVGDDASATGNADADGNYFVPYAPVGTVKVGVNTAAGRGMMMSAVMASAQSGDKSSKPKFLDVPPKFFDPSTSGLTVKVEDSKKTSLCDIKIE
jgi:hypothetical protein